MQSKFNIGDKVRVIKYGHLSFMAKSLHVSQPIIKNMSDGYYLVDSAPELVGRVGIVSVVGHHLQNDGYEYTLNGIPQKHAWYNEEQLELINANPNTLKDE
jgi:hypothetical protein